MAPKLPDGYFARLEIQTAYDYDWNGARESLDLALRLAPGDALLISNASQLATQFGDIRRGLELGRRAAELDPVNAEIRYWLGRTYLCAGLLAEGEAELRRAAELSPFLLSVHRQLAVALVLQGLAIEAVAGSTVGERRVVAPSGPRNRLLGRERRPGGRCRARTPYRGGLGVRRLSGG